MLDHSVIEIKRNSHAESGLRPALITIKMVTLFPFMPQMGPFMHSLVSSAGKASIAKLALEGFFSGMNISMLCQFCVVIEAFSTNITLEFSVVNRSVLERNVLFHFAFADHHTTKFARNFVVKPIHVTL